MYPYNALPEGTIGGFSLTQKYATDARLYFKGDPTTNRIKVRSHGFQTLQFRLFQVANTTGVQTFYPLPTETSPVDEANNWQCCLRMISIHQ